MHPNNIISSFILVLVVLLISGCDKSLFSNSESDAYLTANQIIRDTLKAPASYQVARQEILWSKSIGSETAQIVRTEYDAQNGFGALIRGCQYTSFVTKGDQFTFNPLNGMQPCSDNRESPNWESDKQKIVEILIENANLERFVVKQKSSRKNDVSGDLRGVWNCEFGSVTLTESGKFVEFSNQTAKSIGITFARMSINEDGSVEWQYTGDNSIARGTWDRTANTIKKEQGQLYRTKWVGNNEFYTAADTQGFPLSNGQRIFIGENCKRSIEQAKSTDKVKTTDEAEPVGFFDKAQQFLSEYFPHTFAKVAPIGETKIKTPPPLPDPNSVAAIADPMGVYPQSLNGIKSLELGEAVLLLMPDKGRDFFGWDHALEGPVVWLTDGYKDVEINSKTKTIRQGLMRINVLGKKSTVLKKSMLELGWLVEYQTTAAPKFGVQTINLSPGSPGEICFGSLNKGCDFDPIPSLKASGISVNEVCNSSFLNSTRRGFELSHPDREKVYVLVDDNGGSGGATTSITLQLNMSKLSCSLNDVTTSDQPVSNDENSPLPQGASFDCKKARSTSEILICNDTELSSLDNELAKIYRQAKSKNSDAQVFKKQTEIAWKWRESNCRDKECLLKWYADRKMVLLNEL